MTDKNSLGTKTDGYVFPGSWTETMSIKVDIAMDEAAAHWKRLSKCKTVAEVKAEGFHSKSCSLCVLFLDDGCRGCPIAERTGATYCQETPYEKAEKELCNFIKEYRGTFPRKAVMAELHFIESLRKKA